MPRHDGVFTESWLAGGYAANRPPLHSLILDRVIFPESAGQFDLALDLGCDAGASTAALMRLEGNHVLGVDPSPAMIRAAKRHVESASFVLGSAEALPVSSETVGLMTAAGSLNYADIAGFFSETKRVLSSEGLLVVYDFSSGRCSASSDDLDSWNFEMVQRWPKPNQRAQDVNRETFESTPMHLLAYETFKVSIGFELDGYLDYLMTESNVSAAVLSGVPLAEIRSWCEEGLRQLFRGSVSVEFECYYACLAQPSRHDV